MDGLNNIEHYPLRSLIATKLAKMRQMHIKGVLEALYPVKKQLSMDTDDLLRALGILLDNAMEAVPPANGQVRAILLQEKKELYLEAVGYRHTLRMHLTDELLEFNSSLEHFSRQLGKNFWRCHRSFLVNRSHIHTVHLKEQIIELDNGETCLLSRKAKNEYRTE